ncbi:histidine phosphatase family protein [Novosphingobium percolationis]|uniref:histidine phosphatase family protein n=1 Tax=Novosphingobium percolationis TaxID=2871811 RepID=UPI001CD1A6A7|nr:histidine phosphatase family protein [Novosphingobium percolationis]
MNAFHVHLMRHGAPHAPGRLLGHTDAPTTPEGLAACVQQVADLPFAAVVSSDLVRCAHAAEAIAAPRNLAVTPDPRWRELDFGAWDGLASAEVDSAALAQFWADPDANPPPGGERWSALTARIDAALGGIDRDTLVVTHGGAIRAALACLFGFGQQQLWAFDLPYACVVSLRIWPGAPRTAQIVGLWP